MPHRLQPAHLLAVGIAVSAAGCGFFSGLSGPDGLAYGRPDPNPATYTFSDTAVFRVQTAIGPMEVVTARAGTAELDWRWSDARVRVRFPELRGSFRNPTQGEYVVDQSDIAGPITVHVDRTGMVAVTDTPALSDALLDIAGPEGLVRPFFVQLPGRPVGPGARWVDTVETVEESGGTRSVARSVVTSTFEDDTVVAGRRLLRIRTSSASTIEVTGVSGGVEIEQRLSGTIAGTVLWDEAARLLVERTAAGTLAGTLELPGAGVEPIPVEAELRRTVSLRGPR